MPDQTPLLTEEQRQAVHAAKNAAQASELARKAQEERMAEIIRNEMYDVLSRGSEKDRAVLLARVPFICSEITSINKSLGDIQEALRYAPLIQRLVFSMVAIILTAVVGAVIFLVIK